MLNEGAISLNRDSYPRVAFLPDTFHEINGVAHTSRQFELFAKRRRLPFLSIHCGPTEETFTDGSIRMMQLKRGFASIELDAHLDYDPFLLRYGNQVSTAVKEFGADLIHVTGPGDMGLLGLYVALKLKLPFVISWHTSLHDYAQVRLERALAWSGKPVSHALGLIAGKISLWILKWFYQRGSVLLAPNIELVHMIKNLTGLAVFLMPRGVDGNLFSPLQRFRQGGPFRIGYVGRLTPEKNVRLFAALARGLELRGQNNFEISLIGQGSEDHWLRDNVPNVSFTGVLRGQALAEAYANLDAFVFPSRTDTYGNAVLEALSSGVSAVVTTDGGPKWLIEHGVSGYVAATESDFVDGISKLMTDPHRRRRMSEAARQYASRQSWDSVFENVFRAYETCLPSGPLLASETAR